MQIYLAVTPSEYPAAAAHARNFAHVAYCIGPDSALLRQSLPDQPRGGLLSLSDRDAPCVRDPERLSGAILRECRRRRYSGVLLDLESELLPDRLCFARVLGRELEKQCLALFVPEPLAEAVPTAMVLIGSAVSGGSCIGHLRDAAHRYGAQRCALDAERLRMDFSIPCPTGLGRPLSLAELETLLDRERPSVYFSRELCARYFTYEAEDVLHFVLFDDPDTLLEKLRISASVGFQVGFLVYPEIRDILSNIHFLK